MGGAIAEGAKKSAEDFRSSLKRRISYSANGKSKLESVHVKVEISRVPSGTCNALFVNGFQRKSAA